MDRDILEKTWDLYCTGNAPFKTATVEIKNLQAGIDLMVERGTLSKMQRPEDYMLARSHGGQWR